MTFGGHVRPVHHGRDNSETGELGGTCRLEKTYLRRSDCTTRTGFRSGRLLSSSEQALPHL